jgi:hypothetical protein
MEKIRFFAENTEGSLFQFWKRDPSVFLIKYLFYNVLMMFYVNFFVLVK